ncbi:MAG TPA: ABATE domain-containing protein [Terriglobales bacterium]|nr:ABATE domain-containing protein [Terriglobales bacterium]
MADREFQLVAGNLCLDFINTLDDRGDPERERELLTSCTELLAFLRQSRALTETLLRKLAHRVETSPSAKILDRARQLREALYRIFAAVVEKHNPPAPDLDEISIAWRRVSRHFRLRRGTNGFEWQWLADNETEAVGDRLLWPILRSAVDLLTSSDLERVRACEAETCRWLFLDTSRNHSRRWCDMKVCGNRSKVRRFYQRQRAAQPHSLNRSRS